MKSFMRDDWTIEIEYDSSVGVPEVNGEGIDGIFIYYGVSACLADRDGYMDMKNLLEEIPSGKHKIKIGFCLDNEKFSVDEGKVSGGLINMVLYSALKRKDNKFKIGLIPKGFASKYLSKEKTD